MSAPEVSPHELGAVLTAAVRRSGLRLTGPRRRILVALGQLGHATPETLALALAGDGGSDVAPSTIYRNLEALATAELVRHSHLDHGAPSYYLAEHGDHLHLVCRACGKLTSADPALAAVLARNLLSHSGFDADVTHMAIHGQCRVCTGAAEGGSGSAPQS